MATFNAVFAESEQFTASFLESNSFSVGFGEIQRITVGDYFEGEYTVTPLADESVVLATRGKLMADNVTVLEVPYFETSNVYGDTVYIASEVI